MYTKCESAHRSFKTDFVTFSMKMQHISIENATVFSAMS